MLWRTLLVLVLGLAVSGPAAKVADKGAKTALKKKPAKKAKAKKARKRYTREAIRNESIAAWPTLTEIDSRIAAIGVPELDRLLVDRPPLGASVADDPLSDMDRGSGPMTSSERSAGVASVAFPDPATDPLDRLRKVAEPFLGAPYRTGGESVDGFDCSGFVRTVLRAFGQNLTGRSSTEYYKQGVPVDKDRLQTGDLLFFADHHRSIGHVGIYLAEGKFVHASVGKGVIVSALDEKYYRAKYKAARRHDSFAEALRDPQEPQVVP